MDWTPVIGRHRPLQQDALRILIVVHQLGRRSRAAGIHSSVETESHLQSLDHLVREPVDLAYVVMDQFSQQRELRDRRAGLARKVRGLLTPQDPRPVRSARRDREQRRSRREPFDPGAWERWDDVLAFLGCRGLLRVQPLPEKPRELAYLLTTGGARLLEEKIYPAHPTASPYVERCRLLSETVFRQRESHLGGAALHNDLREVGQRIEIYRRDEQISIEEDLLNHLFQATFGESL